MNAYTVMQRDFQAESYWSDEYVPAALEWLGRADVLTGPPTEQAQADCILAVEAMDNAGLDETDTFPWAVLYTLGAHGLLRDLDDVAAAVDWLHWEENEHQGEPNTIAMPRRIEQAP